MSRGLRIHLVSGCWALLLAAFVGVGAAAKAQEPVRLPPDQLASLLLRWDPESPRLLTRLGEEFRASGPRSEVGDYLVEVARAMALQLDARGSWTAIDLNRLLTVMLVNPGRFVADVGFRYEVEALLRQQSDVSLSVGLRLAMLEELASIPGVDFDMTEAVATAWGLAGRPSTSRYRSAEANDALEISAFAPIATTLLVLSSPFVSERDSMRLVEALQDSSRERELLILHDARMTQALSSVRSGNTRLLSALGRSYTPWPRDTMILGRHADGGVAVILRPNRQPGREEDSDLGRMLLMQLPDDVDTRWERPHWHTARTPFHNGQILLTDRRVWVSIHSLEESILERLGLDRVPAETFGTAEGIDRYLQAARDAAGDLARLFGREPAFVHSLPVAGSAAERGAAMARLAGGGGFDLDSLVTIVPDASGEAVRALVGDVDAGVRTLESLGAADVEALRAEYDPRVGLDPVAAIAAASRSPRGQHLGEFLDDVAEHFTSLGIAVTRLPLLLAPVDMLAERGELEHEDFVIGWNNVVLSRTADGGLLAEGFSSGIPGIDALVAAEFGAAGVSMRYLPPLTGSVIRNGGYRCATNHLRAPDPLTR